MKRLARKALNALGLDILRPRADKDGEDSLTDLSNEEREILFKAKPFTMTSLGRMASLLESVKYVSKNGIGGDIVESGVWRGGSMMLVAYELMALGDLERSLYLYDTYSGMPDPTEVDVDYTGAAADVHFAEVPEGEGNWCEASLEEVKANLLSTGYPEEKIHFIEGRVEDTIPRTLPGEISLLRLDTDWYQSTKHELIHLYPRLSPGGIMIVDDFGYWQGSRKAVVEYFDGSPIYLHRIDNTGRLLVKPGALESS